MAGFHRGTTPILRFTTPGQDWTGYEVWLTLEEPPVELTFKDDRVNVDGSDVMITLTQEETLQFKNKVQAQIKGEKDGNVIATNIEKIKVLPILSEELIGNE